MTDRQMFYAVVVVAVIGFLLIAKLLRSTQKDLRQMTKNNQDIFDQYRQMQEIGMF